MTIICLWHPKPSQPNYICLKMQQVAKITEKLATIGALTEDQDQPLSKVNPSAVTSEVLTYLVVDL